MPSFDHAMESSGRMRDVISDWSAHQVTNMSNKKNNRISHESEQFADANICDCDCGWSRNELSSNPLWRSLLLAESSFNGAGLGSCVLLGHSHLYAMLRSDHQRCVLL